MPRKLLLADDSVTVQRVIELTFADEGMDVVSVGDGNKAISILEHNVPDIILADVSMPGRDGYQVAEHVKNTPHLAHVPVVLMTGAFEPLDEERARSVNCAAVLAKPFEPHMVISLVNQLLLDERPAQGGAPVADVPPAVPAEVPKSLDDYLERLDDALTAATAPLSLRALDGMAAAVSSGTAPHAIAVAHPASPPVAGTPSLAEAFSALLAEELGEALLPPTWHTLAEQTGSEPPAPTVPSDDPRATPAAPENAASGNGSAAPTAAVSEALIEDIADRVARRLADDALRDLVNRRVIEVAERLVREEIERIKSTAQ